MRLRAAIALALLFFSFNLQAQVGTIIDSLTQESQRVRDSRQLFVIYDELVTQWAEANFDSSYLYAKKLHRLALQIDDPVLISTGLLRLGTPHDYHSHFDSAEYYYNKSLTYATAHRDSAGIATASFALATLFYFKGDYPTAIEKYNSVEKMFVALGDERRLARLYNNLGEIYAQTGQYTASIQSYQNSLAIKEKIKDIKGILNTYFNLSKLYQQIGDYTQAENVSVKAVELSRKVNDRMAYKNELLNLGQIYKDKGEFQKSLQNLKEAESLMVPGDPVIFRTECWSNLASVYLELKDFKQLAAYLARFEKEIDQLAPNAVVPYYKLNAQRYAAQGDYKTAYEFYQKYTSEQERVTGEKIQEKTRELEVRYESAKKEQQISQLELDKQKASFELAQNENQRNLFIAVLFALLVIIGLVFYQYRNKQRSNLLLTEKNQTIARSLAERETLLKEIHHRVKNNLQIISSLLSLQSKNVTSQSVQEAVAESRDRVKSISLIHELLYQEDTVSGISMEAYIHRLTDVLWNSYGIDRERVAMQVSADPVLLDADTAIPLGLILNELISNSLKHAFPGDRAGVVTINFKQLNDDLVLSVADNGVGMTGESVKTSFGLELVNSLLRKLKAKMQSKTDSGTSFELVITDYKLTILPS